MKEKLNFKKGNRARTIFRIFNVTFLVFTCLIMIVPILKIFSDSFDKTTQYGLNIFPVHPSLLAYEKIASMEVLRQPLVVSVYTTIVGTLLGLFLTTTGAYVIVQKNLIGRKFFSMFIFITMVFNGGLIPTFLLVQQIGLMDSLWAIILPSSLNVFNLILMKNFFEQIPQSLLESAEIDGCTPMRTFASIVLPLSTAALASIGLFFAVSYWSEYFSYNLYITDMDKKNFQSMLQQLFVTDESIKDPDMAGYSNMLKNACVIVAMAPFLIIYPFCQRYFITGVTMGAVKE